MMQQLGQFITRIITGQKPTPQDQDDSKKGVLGEQVPSVGSSYTRQEERGGFQESLPPPSNRLPEERGGFQRLPPSLANHRQTVARASRPYESYETNSVTFPIDDWSVAQEQNQKLLFLKQPYPYH